MYLKSSSASSSLASEIKMAEAINDYSFLFPVVLTKNHVARETSSCNSQNAKKSGSCTPAKFNPPQRDG